MSQSTSASKKSIFETACNNGLRGAGAMVIQVSSLMWMRTTMNYQYKNGGGMVETIKKLYAEGGVPRFYRGIAPALMIGPLTRFIDTASNEGAMRFFEGKQVPIAVQTGCASVAAGVLRMSIVPIDTWKTSKQVHGDKGIQVIREKMSKQGVSALYQGTLASGAATMAGHYPWFLTYNYCNHYIPQIKYSEHPVQALFRNAGIGFCASLVSDTVSNSIRVVKTYKQTSAVPITYAETVRDVLKHDGVSGLLFRGLKTKILTNGIQGVVFSVFYKLFLEVMPSK